MPKTTIHKCLIINGHFEVPWEGAVCGMAGPAPRASLRSALGYLLPACWAGFGDAFGVPAPAGMSALWTRRHSLPGPLALPCPGGQGCPRSSGNVQTPTPGLGDPACNDAAPAHSWWRRNCQPRCSWGRRCRAANSWRAGSASSASQSQREGGEVSASQGWAPRSLKESRWR
jgi:hypothetical protein